MNKSILWGIFALIVLVGFVVAMKGPTPTSNAIDSFDECVQAGYPVMKSYPAQCATPDGRTFTQIIDEPIAESWGSIQGTVLLGPTCPVMQDPPDSQCDDKPYAGQFVLTTADGSRIVKEFRSDSNGRFTIEVPPGSYAIRSNNGNIFPQCGTNDPIIVKANDSTEVNVNCDSGIR